MKQNLLSQVKAHYGDTKDKSQSFTDLVSKTIKNPQKQSDLILKEWLVQLSFEELRLAFKSETEAAAWIAFTVRYLEPLLGTEKLNEWKLVFDVLAKVSKIRAIMYGDAKEYAAILQTIFPDQQAFQVTLTPEQIKMAERVNGNYPSQRTLKDYCELIVQKLSNLATERIYSATSETVDIIRGKASSSFTDTPKLDKTTPLKRYFASMYDVELQRRRVVLDQLLHVFLRLGQAFFGSVGGVIACFLIYREVFPILVATTLITFILASLITCAVFVYTLDSVVWKRAFFSWVSSLEDETELPNDATS
jgi:hypothetical protein